MAIDISLLTKEPAVPAWLFPNKNPYIEDVVGPVKMVHRSFEIPDLLARQEYTLAANVAKHIWDGLHHNISQSIFNTMLGSKDFWILKFYWNLYRSISFDSVDFVFACDIFTSPTHRILIPEFIYTRDESTVKLWKCGHCGFVNPYKDRNGGIVTFCGQSFLLDSLNRGCGAPRAISTWERV